jgi:hypothetical protein
MRFAWITRQADKKLKSTRWRICLPPMSAQSNLNSPHQCMRWIVRRALCRYRKAKHLRAHFNAAGWQCRSPRALGSFPTSPSFRGQSLSYGSGTNHWEHIRLKMRLDVVSGTFAQLAGRSGFPFKPGFGMALQACHSSATVLKLVAALCWRPVCAPF